MPTSCHGCGARVSFDGPVGRRTTCPQCDADLHACINCKHYDESSARSCREPHADMIVDKIGSNACDLYQLGDGASRRRVRSDEARNALGALFGEAPVKREDPKDALEALFKKK